MAYSAGVAFLQVVPSFQGVERGIRNMAADLGKEIDKSVADALPKGMAEGAKEAKREGERAGNDYSGALANTLHKRLDKAYKALPELQITPNSTAAEKSIARIRDGIREVRDQHINLQIDDDAALAAARKFSSQLERINRSRTTAGLKSNAAEAKRELGEIEKFATSLFDKAQTSSLGVDAFSKGFRKAVLAAESEIPPIELTVDPRRVDRSISAIGRDLKRLASQSISGLDFDDTKAVEKLKSLQERLQRLHDAAGKDIRLKANAAAALKPIEAFFKELHAREAAAQAEAKKAQDLAERQAKKEQDLAERQAKNDQALADKAKAQAKKDADQLAREAENRAKQVKQRLAEQDKIRKAAAREEARLAGEAQKAQARAFQEAQRLTAARVRNERAAAAEAEKAQRQQVQDDRRAESERVKAAREADRLESKAKKQAADAERQALRDSKLADAAAERSMGGLGRRVKTQLDEAIAQTRPVQVDVDAGPAEKRIGELRRDMERLRDLRIGVDVDAATAIAEIKRIRSELEKVGRKSKDVQVRADVIGAIAALKSVEKVADKLDGRHVNLNVDLDKAASSVEKIGTAADTSLTRFGALIATAISLGTVLVPAAAAAAVAVGAIGTAAGSALAGVGVVALSLFGIADAVKALNDAQNATAKTAKSLGSSENQVANAVDGVTAAERGLKRAREDAAYAAVRSEQQVASARRQVTDADKEAKKAQEGLLQAIKDVRQEEEDRTLQLRDNALAQRQANLDVADAKKALDELIANPRATNAEIEQSRISYEERILQIDKLGVAQERLKAEQEDAAKKGVAGSDKVVAAQERIASASQSVTDAQQNLANALEDQKRQQKQSSDAILSATEQLAQAQRSLRQAYTATGAAGGAALQTLEQKMAALSPAGKKFALFIFGLKDEFLSLRDAAAEGFLPGAQEAIANLLPALPKVRDYISGVATALGDIAVRVSQSLGDPSWQKFFKFIADQTVPTLNGLVTVTLNIAAGTRDLFLALTAFNKPIGTGLIQLSESFAKWAAQLDSSQGYRKFLAYVQDVGPDVVAFFIELGRAVLHIIEAAAPVGAIVLHVLDVIVSFINGIPTGTLSVIIGIIAAFAATMLILAGISKTVAAYQSVAGSVMKAYGKTTEVTRAIVAAFNRTEKETLITTGTLNSTLANGTTTLTVLGDAHRSTAEKVGELGDAHSAAATRTGELEQGVTNAADAAEKSKGKFSALSDLIGGGGPLGLAVAGLTLLFGYQIDQEAKNAAAADDLRNAIQSLGKAYRDTHNLGSQQVQDTIRQSKELTNLLVKTDQYGIATEKVARAAAGERDAQADVLAALKAKREELERQIANNPAPLGIAGFDSNNAASKANDARAKQILLIDQEEKALKSAFDQANANAVAEDALAAATERGNRAFQNAPDGLRKYVDSLDKLLDKQTTAAEKTNILRQMDEDLYGAQRNLQEALEAQAQAHRDLNDILSDKNLLDQKGARALDINTEAGQRLTDGLEAELNAIRETYLANIANGDSIEEATKKHDDQIAVLRKSVDSKKLDKDATEKLIETYGQVPTDRVTAFSTRDFDVTKQQLDELMAYQLALREGISLEAARDKLNPVVKVGPGRGNSQNAQLAAGGPVRGPGTRTSDSVPAWIPETGTPFRLSNGEFVHKADAVDYYGQGLMHAINEKRIPKAIFRIAGYAGGGIIDQVKSETYPFPYTTKTTKIPTKDEVGRAVRNNQDTGGPRGAGPGFLPWPSSPMAQRGDTGVWHNIVDLVRDSGIPFTFGNAYRPGDPLWHGSGRAVDFMGYNQDRLAQFFIDRLPHVLELIHLTDKGGYFVTRGVRKANFPVQGPLHRNHLHIAMAGGGLVQPPQLAHMATYDSGGHLPPGLTLAYNGTGRTEQVLTSRQMADVALLAKQASAGGNAYNFAFRDTTLDASKLRAIQNREAALARSGRAR